MSCLQCPIAGHAKEKEGLSQIELQKLILSGALPMIAFCKFQFNRLCVGEVCTEDH